jgi:GDP-mannose 6-dehydrogenase
MRVSVFGLGYVGCVTAACLARAGHQVVGVDVNRQKVEMVNEGRSPLVEPGLGELIAQVVARGGLRATASTAEAVRVTDLALICVGTPGRASGQLDTSAVERVGEEIGRALAGRDRYTVVLRSTVLPGTVEERLGPAIARGAGRPPGGWLRLAVNPEFMREGSSIEDFARPPFTVVGTADDETAEMLRALYAGADAPFVRTSIRSAEMVKYACNAFHAACWGPTPTR